jgi:hypothetical protein
MSRIDGSNGPVRQPRIDARPTEAKPQPQPQTNTARTTPPQVRDRFATAGTSAATASRSGGAGQQPAAVKTGTLDYYKQRYDDFVRRNPGVKPPDYYLSYGDKYCQKFSQLGPKDLTPQGLKWRDATLKNLQNAIEKKRMEDPEGFAKLERDPAAFKKFCYDSHPDAYIQGGLFKLPAQDLLKIGSTPELRDLLGKDGIRQTVEVLKQMGVKDLGKIGMETLKELGRDLGDLLPDIHLPEIRLPKLSFSL